MPWCTKSLYCIFCLGNKHNSITTSNSLTTECSGLQSSHRKGLGDNRLEKLILISHKAFSRRPVDKLHSTTLATEPAMWFLRWAPRKNTFPRLSDYQGHIHIVQRVLDAHHIVPSRHGMYQQLVPSRYFFLSPPWKVHDSKSCKYRLLNSHNFATISCSADSNCKWLIKRRVEGKGMNDHRNKPKIPTNIYTYDMYRIWNMTCMYKRLYIHKRIKRNDLGEVTTSVEKNALEPLWKG